MGTKFRSRLRRLVRRRTPSPIERRAFVRRAVDSMAIHLKFTVAAVGSIVTAGLFWVGRITQDDALLSGFLINLSASTFIIVVTVLLLEALQDRRVSALQADSAIMAYDKVEHAVRRLVGTAKHLCLKSEASAYIDDDRLRKLSADIDKNGRYWEFVWLVRKLEIEQLNGVPDEQLGRLQCAEASVLREDLIGATQAVRQALDIHGPALDPQTHARFVYIWQMLNDCWGGSDRTPEFLAVGRSGRARIGQDGAYYMRSLFDALDQSREALETLPLAKLANYWNS
jgi:hypothetical protein